MKRKQQYNTSAKIAMISIIGIVIFNDKITLSILIGGGLVVCSGIFAAWRNHKNNQATLTSKI